VCLLALVAVASASAQPKSCPELAAEIAAQLDASGVKAYQIDIVAAGEVGDKQVVGSCENGGKKITFKRTSKSKSARAKR
jgi:hypothetical protein